ncbi:hypothetical protein [uncultured Ornithinimicrobium sp.]|uniref:hypothetical protein n=1 Tax=uncultured Ornithinimicrobium sp. TaxID=259307 RepID=UPI002592164C|nr:hypothetical protein [uncultured Ornithinimicrobium sp.]
MANNELATLQAASSTASALVRTANSVYLQIKRTGMANAQERELLRIRLEEARALETAEGIYTLHRQKLRHVRDLFDEAERYEGTARYAAMFSTALEASEMLEENIRQFVRRVSR